MSVGFHDLVAHRDNGLQGQFGLGDSRNNLGKVSLAADAGDGQVFAALADPDGLFNGALDQIGELLALVYIAGVDSGNAPSGGIAVCINGTGDFGKGIGYCSLLLLLASSHSLARRAGYP